MGLGFIIILLSLSVLLLLAYLLTGEKTFVWILILGWGGVIALICVICTFSFFHTKKVVHAADIYGSYVIDRARYPGKQADWQYDHFRLKIDRNDGFILFQTDGERIVRKVQCSADFVEGRHASSRLIITPQKAIAPILGGNPALYRSIFSFYYVFQSPLYGNMFFKKGTWHPRN